MKRSNQVMLTAVFLTSVSSYAAKAQDVQQSYKDVEINRADIDHTPLPEPRQQEGNDTLRGHHPHGGVYISGHSRGFLGIFGHHHHSEPAPPTNQSHSPRTQGGFGNTLRKSPATASAHS